MRASPAGLAGRAAYVGRSPARLVHADAEEYQRASLTWYEVEHGLPFRCLPSAFSRNHHRLVTYDARH